MTLKEGSAILTVQFSRCTKMITEIPFMLTEFTLGQVGGEGHALQRATQLYNGMCRAALRGKVWSALSGHSYHLDELAKVQAARTLFNGHDEGLQTVPIHQIRGSENRCRDFDAWFHPLQSRTRERWLHIAAARLRGATLPPVELIQVGNSYFVRDGHHRISVARALGEEFIEAQVTVRLVTPEQLPKLIAAGALYLIAGGK
jgi:hypothetical protein